ncbi:ABC transporter substrate-binding protein [Facklamia lactis]|uniref:ABC transporter substrate-binding protein n=1 Tax=Facklamia lactis TaxID=2749967 RepID=UPI0018CFD16C|nr:ABC transporter substrate-binding protein [Facklamia lactis]MBG9980485.1 ABC transporter substrate-binding protein [Facklamia lactis]
MRKFITALFVSLIMLVSLPLGINAQESDTFTYAISGDPMSTNPLNASDRWGLTYTNMIFSPLMRVNEDGSTKYELAESFEIAEDGLSAEMKLKEGLKWSDGEAITADDVIFTYTTKAKKENGSSDAFWIGEKQINFEKVDDLTVKFVLPEVSAAAINKLSFENYIIPEHIYSEVTDFSESSLPIDPIGSGPYKFVEYKNGEYIKFEANDQYYGGEAGIKNIIFRIIPETDAVKVALQTGEVDASMVGVMDMAELSQSDLDVYSYSEGGIGYIGMNLSSDNLQEQKVRQAIMYATNREEINQAIYQDKEYYEPAYSFLPQTNQFYNDDVEHYDYNLEKAKTLLEEVGVDNLKINIGYDSTSKTTEMMVTLLKEQLAQAGIELELLGSDQATVINEMLDPESKKYDLFVNGYVFGVEPDAYSAMFGSEGSFNIFHVKNDKIDELFNAGQKELDVEKRKEIYNELQSVIAEEAIFFPHATGKKIIVSNKRIQGYEEAKFVPIYSLEDMSKLKIVE